PPPPPPTLFPYTTLFRSKLTNLAIAHHVEQGHNVWPACEVLQDLDLALYLLLLDRLEDLDDTFLVVYHVDALKHLRVLAEMCHRSEEHTSELQSQSNLVC